MTIKRVSYHFYPILYFLLAFLISSRMGEAKGIKIAKTECEKGFYAISSLRFHVTEIVRYKPSIKFSDADIDNLWLSAQTNLPSLPDIEKAKTYYYRAKSQSDAQSARLSYEKADRILNIVWENLDNYLIKGMQLEIKKDDHSMSLSEKIKSQAEPHFLPSDHPAKFELDSIFSQSRIINNRKTLTEAGFLILSVRPFTHLIVAQHPQLSDYCLKFYLDSETRRKRGEPGWESLLNRCKTARRVRQLIETKKLVHFSVPNKWLYPLPALYDEHSEFIHRDNNLLLLVDDMHLVSQAESEEVWKNKVTREHINELYVILSHGCGSCHLSWNVPYTTSGKFAFIDTERLKKVPNYSAAQKYLSAEMYAYLVELVKTGGKNLNP